MDTTDDDADELTVAIEALQTMHDARSCREAWSVSLEAAARWSDPVALRRLVGAARRDLVRDRAADWCRDAAAVLDSIDEGRRWAVVDFASVGIRADDVIGLWSPGLPAALRAEGVDAPDAAVLVNVAGLVRSSLPAVCREAPADIWFTDEAAGLLVLVVALHEAAHGIVDSATLTAGPTIATLRVVVPGIRDPRPDHHDARWAWALAVLTARVVRTLPTTPRDWCRWLWEAIEADIDANCGIPAAAVLTAAIEGTRRPWNHDPAGDPPAGLVELFQRRDDAASPGEAAA